MGSDYPTCPGPLFATPRVRHDAPATSREAAAAVPRSGTCMARILAAIASRGSAGLTRDEAAATTGINPNTVNPRWRDLVDGGFIRNTGTTRKTAGGVSAEVWVCTVFGEEAAKAGRVR